MSYPCQIVVDFEFNPVEKQYRELIKDEIIEIGAVKLNEHFEEIGRFSCYVKPELNAHVDPRITKLTGIRDADICRAASFEEAVGLFAAWAGTSRCRVFSWSDNDLVQLERECDLKDVQFPGNLWHWIDLQRVWQRLIGYPDREFMSLKYALSLVGIIMDSSKAHRALYDSEMTAELLKLAGNKNYVKAMTNAKTSVKTAVEHSTFTIGSVFGDKLAGLMLQLA